MARSAVHEMKYSTLSSQLHRSFAGKYCVTDFAGVNGVIF